MFRIRRRLGNKARALADRWAPHPPPQPAPPPRPEDPYLKRCLGAEGEDLLLERFLRRARFGLYVDVGAHHPVRLSRTFLLHEAGWSGVNVVPDREALAAFEASRPTDVNVQAADSAAREAIELPPHRLSDLLDEHLGPQRMIDLLTIDVEPAGPGVLGAIDWDRHRPGLIAVGITNCLTVGRALDSAAGRLLVDRRYELLARTCSTALFGDPEYMGQWFVDDLHGTVSAESLTRRRIERAARPRVVLGSGGVRYQGWIDTDIDVLDVTDPAAWCAVFGDHRAEALLAEHVFEHIALEALPSAFASSFEHLVPGGRLRVAVPDGCRTDAYYREQNEPPADGHTILFDRDGLTAMLADAGFACTPLEWFDPDGAFHATEWDPADGMIRRSARFDRQEDFRRSLPDRDILYTSLIIDATKPRYGAMDTPR